MTGRVAEVAAVASREEAFTRLAREHLDASYRLARAILDDPSEAEDATHDAFIRAWRAWDSLRDPSRFEAWFGRILVNTCRNQLRHRARVRVREVVPELSVLGDDGAVNGIASAEARTELDRALARLDGDHRIVVALRFYADLTVDGIAERIGVPAGTVKSRLHHALRRIRADLDASGHKGIVR
jgi:RNA polymerase sigma-70 factor (ECF subfamily)